ELLWLRQSLECATCREHVQCPPNGGIVGAQSPPLAQRLLPRLCGQWRQDAIRSLRILPLADDRRAETPAGAAAPSPTAPIVQAAPREDHTRRGEHVVRPAERRLLTQRTQPVSRREPHGIPDTSSTRP